MPRTVTSRRRFLAGASTAAAIGLAGCSSSGSTRSVSDLAAPALEEGLLDSGGWAPVDQFTDERAVADLFFTTVDAFSLTHVYEKETLRARVREDTLGNFDEPLAMFFASRTDLDPGIDSVPGAAGTVIDQANDQAREMFVDQLENRGLTDVRESGETTLAVDSGQEATVYGYEAKFEYPGMQFPLAEGEEVEIPGGSLEIYGEYGIWHDGEYLMVAGGAIPGENFHETIDRSITDAIEVSVEIDLGLRPEALLAEVRHLAASAH